MFREFIRLGINRGAGRSKLVRSRRQQQSLRRKLVLESLEDRRLLAANLTTGIVTGTVWNDANGNGVRDTGEGGLMGALVYADTIANGKYDRGEPATTSGRDGSYRLALSAGTYTLAESLPSLWQVTAPAGGTGAVTVTSGKTTTGPSFGNQYVAATISGSIYHDANGNGVRDTGDAAQSGWQIFADTNDNGTYDAGEPATMSGRDGSYKLTVAPGTYKILEVARSGWQTTAPTAGSYTLTVAAGNALTKNDFGNLRAVAAISGTVWNDANGNGVRDANESGLFGWQVFADRNDNGLYDVGEPTAISGRDGSYKLAVIPGTYTIRETPLTGWQTTVPTGGTYTVTVALGQTLTNNDFANRRAVGTISGVIWNDADGNGARDTGEAGLSGWLVFADSNGNNTLDTGEVSTFSARDGSYQLTVPPGTYTILESLLPGWQTTAPADDYYTVSVAIGDALTNNDFGNQQTTGTISGSVWNDANGNGVRDTGETGLAGWQVFADSDGNGKLDAGEVSATTGRDGSYQLTVAPGTYTVLETVPSGWTLTAPAAGSYTATVAARETIAAQDFGNQQQTNPTGGFHIDLSFVGLSVADQALAQQAAGRWEKVIVGDLPSAVYRGRVIDDILINISVQRIDGSGNAIAEGGPDLLRVGSRLPYLGSITLDSADLSQMETQGELMDVLTHEMGHVLGLGTIWALDGLISGANTSNPLFIGRQATATYNAMFGTNAAGVPVESGGGLGTAGGHWRNSVFGNELMVGWVQAGGMPLSQITVASMADLGYQVNLAGADAYTPPTPTSARAARVAAAAGVTTIVSSFKTECADSGMTAADMFSKSWHRWASVNPGFTDSAPTTANASTLASSRKDSSRAALEQAFATSDWWLEI